MVGLKEPHAELPQVTDQLTPPFLLSLVTVAVILAVAPITSVVGGEELRATEMAGGVGGGGVELDPPQAVRQMVRAAMMKREMVWRSFTGRLPLVHSG
jgi:hypothetical protein